MSMLKNNQLEDYMKYLVFHRCEVLSQVVLSPFTLNDLELNLIRPDNISEGIARSLIFQLRGELLKYKDCRKADPVYSAHPTTWWDMLKLQYAPKWFLKKFPANFSTHKHEISINLEALFPEFKYIPKNMGSPLVMVTVLVDDNGKPNERTKA